MRFGGFTVRRSLDSCNSHYRSYRYYFYYSGYLGYSVYHRKKIWFFGFFFVTLQKISCISAIGTSSIAFGLHYLCKRNKPTITI